MLLPCLPYSLWVSVAVRDFITTLQKVSPVINIYYITQQKVNQMNQQANAFLNMISSSTNKDQNIQTCEFFWNEIIC